MSAAQRACLAEAILVGYEVLRRGGAAIAAVEGAIRLLEGSGLFNAGTGSRVQLDGARRMDASIMDGRALRAGAVAGIEEVRHPISAARLVMEQTAHVLLIGEPATRFARHFGLERTPSGRSGHPIVRTAGLRKPSRKTLRLYKEMTRKKRKATGTVGAVALDRTGTLAAGASTGGIAAMLPGRVGDSPLIGCGVYADNGAGAVSMTGWGESIIRVAVAKEIVDRMAGGVAPGRAARETLGTMAARLREEATAGALVLAPDGRWAIRHTTVRMSAGYWDGRGEPFVADRFR